MELKFAMVADHITETREGKLVIVGEFDHVFSPQFPMKLPRLYTVFRFVASTSEGPQHRFRVAIVDADGKQVVPPPPELPFAFRPQGAGRLLRGQEEE